MHWPQIYVKIYRGKAFSFQPDLEFDILGSKDVSPFPELEEDP
jgi:hypothetical protein